MSSLFELARRTPFNIAPEKGENLAKQVFESGNWSIAPSETEANFYAVVETKTIYLSYAGLASLWCLSHVVFQVTDLLSRLSRDTVAKKQEAVDIGHFWQEKNLDKYLDYARSLCRKDSQWPQELNVPNAQEHPDTKEGRTNNLFFGALSWIMLHEIGHVHKKHQRFLSSGGRKQQEFEADGFATKWILDDAGRGLQREFRVLMIVVAFAWLFLHEQVKGGGNDHPLTILRFREAVNMFGLGQRSAALENATYLLKAIFDPENTDMPVGMIPKEAFDWMVGRMEKIFPAN